MALTEEQKLARAKERQRSAALKAEGRAHRDEAKRREWREKDMYLTREQAAAGEPCRGCGLPVIDNRGSWPATMNLTADERIEYDAARARYKEMHATCDGFRWSMEGSRTTHCGYCCPPVPLAQSQIEDLVHILKSSKPRDEDLDTWVRELTCGHQVEQRVHHTNQHPSFATEPCPECGITRGVVSSTKIKDGAAVKQEMERKHRERVAKAERAVTKAEREAQAARDHLEAIRTERFE